MPTHDAPHPQRPDETPAPNPAYDRLLQRLRQPLGRRALGGLAAGALGAASAWSVLDEADAKKKKKKKKSKKKGQPTTAAPTTATPTPTTSTTSTTAGPGVPNFAFQQELGVMAEDTPDVLNYPLAVATGPDDAVYVLDGARIITFSSDGVYLASYGSAGTGEGEFNYPEVLAVDSDGWMYVADPSGDGPGDPWRVQVLDEDGEFVTSLQPNSGNLGRVDGITIRDDGRVFATSIAWGGGPPPHAHQILAWDWNAAASDFTFAGAWNVPDLDPNYASGNSGNRAAIDSDGWLYVMVGYQEGSSFFHGIRVLDTEDDCAIITSYDTEYRDGAGEFRVISGLAVAADGTLYVTDNNNSRIQRFAWDRDHLAYDGQFGAEGSGLDKLGWPCGVVVNSAGKVLIADAGNSRILQLDGDLTNPRRVNPLPPAGVFQYPYAATQDADKNYYITDITSCLVHKLGPNGAPITAWGGYGTGNSDFAYPGGIAIHEDRVYVSDYDNSRIQVFDTDGVFQSTITHGSLMGPAGMAFDSGGVLYVADDVTNRIESFADGAHAIGWSGPAGFDPWEVAVSSAARVHVLDYQNNAVHVFTTAGALLNTYLAGDYPEGMALDADNNIYIGSDDVREILVLSSTGRKLTTLDIEWITYSRSLLIDADGNLIQLAYSGVRRFTPAAGRAGRQHAGKDGRKNRKDRNDHKGGKGRKGHQGRKGGKDGKGHKGRQDHKRSTRGKRGENGIARHERNRAGGDSSRADRPRDTRGENPDSPPYQTSRKREDLA